tara:strand:- start:477 stop:668 length:192 start_codon:yes stop_codon:yes gene_type:complete
MTYTANKTINVDGTRILKGTEVEVYRAISPSTLVKLYEVKAGGYSFKLAESTLNKFFSQLILN